MSDLADRLADLFPAYREPLDVNLPDDLAELLRKLDDLAG